ncbi:bag family molecular chaperone regulator 8, chloroplastic [Fagus crenata]
MASHHHHHHHQSYSPPTTTTTSPCCCNSCSCCSPSHVSQPLPDPLLQALALHILQSTPQNHHQHNHHHDPYSQPIKLHPQNQYQHHQRSQNPRFQEIPATHSLLSSLLRRIDALESSLHDFSISSSPPSYYCPPHSLRDLAARVIQTHFRAFLVRRSRTLGHLKDLALIKSAFNSLKSSFSSETHFDFDVLSHKAMNLLLKLDSIQGRDPMIRDGKRSISRDLVRFLEFIDGVAVKRRGLSFKATKNMSFDHPNGNKCRVLGTKIKTLGGQREVIQKLRARAEKISGFIRASQNDEDDVELEGFQQAIDDEEEEEEENPRVVISGKNGQIRNGVLVKRNGVQSRVKKSVSFAENGNVYRVFSNAHEPISSGNGTSLDESVSSDDEEELEGNLCSELEEVKGFPQGTEEEEEAHLENVGSPQTSDGERYNARVLRNGGDYEIRGHCHDQNGDFLYSAPLPVKMESKADQMKKRRAVKIGT